jgi:uncharacterized protein (TIGR03083 family)
VWHRWHEAGLRIRTWTTPSGLGDWTVRELYAHVARGVETFVELLAQPPIAGEPEVPDAAAYFAALRPLGAAGAAHVAETARVWAAARTDGELVDVFAAPAAKVLGELNEDVVVRGIAGTIRVGDYAVTRVLEATVHLLDLADAVPQVSPPPPDALRRTVDVLTDLTPPADFVRLATGRPSAPVFPVLS